jgi:hypothetical protein
LARVALDCVERRALVRRAEDALLEAGLRAALGLAVGRLAEFVVAVGMWSKSPVLPYRCDERLRVCFLECFSLMFPSEHTFVTRKEKIVTPRS